MRNTMSAQEALKLDSELYVEYDPEHGQYFVFGDNTGFAYSGSSNKAEAEETAKRLNARRVAVAKSLNG